MKKDIYIIKNKINDKVYVGQALDSAERFRNHCKPSSAKDGSLIDFAIQKYGVENFWFEILESQIENYNEREKYWIKYFNCQNPNGYNILAGGEDPPIFKGIEHPIAAVKSEEILLAIKEDLKNTTLSLAEIGFKYGISKRTVLRINQGLHYAKLDEEYPLRKKPNLNGKLTAEDVSEIIEILKFSYRQYEDIAAEYGVSIGTIKEINAGRYHKVENEKYPIRNYKNSGKPAVTYEQVTEIIFRLQTETKSLNQLAKEYGVNVSVIQGINNGSSKRYYRDEVKYPIRKYN